MTKRPLLFDTLNLKTLSKKAQQTIAAIDSVLPQTQCGLCGYKDGCLPYAHAIVTCQESPNLCVPGGDDVSQKLSQILNKPPLPAVPSKWPTNPNTNRPTKMLAIIYEDDCIGCTKCIVACPVDAIIGTAKHMHSVLPSLCTGCELCVAPCPTDCIDLVAHDDQQFDSQSYRQQYYHKLDRLADTLASKPIVSHTQASLANISCSPNPISQDDSQKILACAKLRVQIKKLEKQLDSRFDEQKQRTLNQLHAQLAQLED